MNEVPVAADISEMLARTMPAESSESTPIPQLSPEQMRAFARQSAGEYQASVASIEVHAVRDEAIPGRDGSIPGRVYSSETPGAVIVYFHGGSWTTGDLDTHDLVTRRFARDCNAMVVAVCYRKWPEDPFPAPFHDAVDATAWASDLHPRLPLLVAGDSAGGTLAACVALHARDSGGPRLDGQVLIYPAVDDDPDVPSMASPAEGAMLSSDELLELIARYASTGEAVGSPYALPDRAASLKHLPPAIMVIPGHDLLRSSEERYAERLRSDAVPVVVQLDLDLVHAWVEMAEAVPSADRAFTRLTDSVNALIASARPVAPVA